MPLLYTCLASWSHWNPKYHPMRRALASKKYCNGASLGMENSHTVIVFSKFEKNPWV
jgi:hypothetical protein